MRALYIYTDIEAKGISDESGVKSLERWVMMRRRIDAVDSQHWRSLSTAEHSGVVTLSKPHLFNLHRLFGA